MDSIKNIKIEIENDLYQEIDNGNIVYWIDKNDELDNLKNFEDITIEFNKNGIILGVFQARNYFYSQKDLYLKIGWAVVKNNILINSDKIREYVKNKINNLDDEVKFSALELKAKIQMECK